MSEPTPAPAPAPPQTSDLPRAPIAWQPFTPKGIAAFAGSTFGRLFIVQVIVTVLASAAVLWFLLTVWVPIVSEAIRNVSGDGAIRARQLEISGRTTERLVTNRFLTFAIDAHTDKAHTYSADVFVVLRRGHYQVCSFFGCHHFAYPIANAPFNRLELEARWGAWQPFVLGMAAAGNALGLLFFWWILATLYFVFVRTFAFFSDRDVTFGGSWRLCGAAVLTGALLLTTAIVGYGFGVVDLLGLLLIAVLHVIVPWVLIVLAVLALPRITARGPGNPFSSPTNKPNAATESTHS